MEFLMKLFISKFPVDLGIENFQKFNKEASEQTKSQMVSLLNKAVPSGAAKKFLKEVQMHRERCMTLLIKGIKGE